ncbi:MAG TPA: hypothetical protein VGH87_30115 [Polyangiaceae bacterium]|nr:hypothetical protein [Polyangiaceae bacterium]
MKPMVRIAAVLLLIACGKPQPVNEVTVAPLPSATVAPTTTTVAATASATAAPSASSASTPVVGMRCSPSQLNVPCVFQSNGKCFVRRANCTNLPCTESAPVEVPCDVYAKAHDATACDVLRACRGVSDEGCKEDTGCRPQMATCIEKSCAPKVLAATACSAIPMSCIK